MNAERSIEQDVQEILSAYPCSNRDSLIPILLEIQEEHGFLSREAIEIVSKCMDMPASRIYSVATFHNRFRFSAYGLYHIQVCCGTACHVKGSGAVLDSLKRELKIEPGKITRDGMFSLEVVACIGACGLAPVINVDGNFHANLSVQQISGLINHYREQAQ